MAKQSHGGTRPGAGRKPGNRGTKQPLTVKLSPIVHEFFATIEESRATFLERITISSKEFRNWSKKLSENNAKPVE